jgi:hypothetical protein
MKQNKKADNMKTKRITNRGVIITFTVKSGAKKNSEKTKFFKKLYGWTQTIPGKNKEYEYHREGVLDEVPHKKIAQSAFIIPEQDFEKIEEFFEQWQKKVIWNPFKVLIEDDSIFEEFDRLRKQMLANEGEEEETEEEEEDEQEENYEDDEVQKFADEEKLDEEDEAIVKRFKQWQKIKKKSG